MAEQIVLIDYMNTLFMSWHEAKKQVKMMAEDGDSPDWEFQEEDLPFFYHVFLKSINYIFSTYGRVHMCYEGMGSLDWRRSVYPGYKGNRKKSKGTNEYAVLKSAFPVLDEVLKNYPGKFLKVDGCEADDVMFNVALYEAAKGNDVLIVSTDKDMIQTKNYYDNIECYNPIQRKFYEKSEDIVQMKAVCGDASDGIPGLYRIGPKTYEKMVADPVLWNKKMSVGTAKADFEAFKKIIDLNAIPEEKKTEIIDHYVATEWNELDTGNLEVFMWENKLNEHLERWGRVSSSISSRINANMEEIEDVSASVDAELDKFFN